MSLFSLNESGSGVMWRGVSALGMLFKKGPQESCGDGIAMHLDCDGVYMKLYLG